MFEDPSGVSSAAMLAVEALLQANISEEAIEKGVLSDAAVRMSPRLLADLKTSFSNHSFDAIFNKIVSLYPKNIMSRRPELNAFRERLRKIPPAIQTRLVNEACDWAEYAVEHLPDLTVELCTSPAGRYLLYGAIQVQISLPVTSGTKKTSRLKEKFLDRIAKLMPQIETEIRMQCCSMDEDACVLIAADKLFGGLHVFTTFVLARQYCYYLSYLAYICIGLPEDELEKLQSLCDWDHLEFTREVAEYSELIDILGPDALLVAFSDSDIGSDFSESVAYRLQLIACLAEEFETCSSEFNKQLKQRDLTEASLKKSLTDANREIERLCQSSATEKMQAVLSENQSLKAELDQLRNELALKNERLAKVAPTPAAAAPKARQEGPVLPLPHQESAPRFSEKDNLELLKNMKAIVVGGHPIFHNKLSQILPDWSFYNADETGVPDALIKGCDLVVFHTNYCSHKLTEGVLSNARQYQKLVAYAYKVNPTAFLDEVASEVRKRS